ncbi:MAG TPA: hypothetical protein VI793_18290 [Anaerolineales bacterium]|nr:hypothetical protein [Anaerolineales bacterium]
MDNQARLRRRAFCHCQAMVLFAKYRRIAAKIESLFAQAEAIEQAVGVARRRAKEVDQAILARAFRGEL